MVAHGERCKQDDERQRRRINARNDLQNYVYNPHDSKQVARNPLDRKKA